jgi:oligopeptide/dipeptide ABC transporter ATP-binding protein
MSGPLLEVDGLRVALHRDDRLVPIVRDVTFAVRAGETLGLVGESGCGKTLSMMALLGLLPEYADISVRSIRWKGREISLKGAHALRGGEIAVVFQDPMTAMNPLMTVGDQITEVLCKHQGVTKALARERAADLLAEVGLSEPERLLRQHSWQLSGGMAQRVLIAMALAPNPSVLVADEPTTAIDASVRKRVLSLISDLQEARGLGVVLISHDLAVVRSQADELAVMYAGRIVERGDAIVASSRPQHPYTKALIACTLDPFSESVLSPIDGEPPRPESFGHACAFGPRCPRATERCDVDPELSWHGDTSLVACWHPEEVTL